AGQGLAVEWRVGQRAERGAVTCGRPGRDLGGGGQRRGGRVPPAEAGLVAAVAVLVGVGVAPHVDLRSLEDDLDSLVEGIAFGGDDDLAREGSVAEHLHARGVPAGISPTAARNAACWWQFFALWGRHH